MFEYENEFGILEQFTQEDVDNRAEEKGLTTEEYLAKNPAVKPIAVEKTNDVAETGAPVASETPAPGIGVSFSDDISLDVPETKLEPGEFGKYVFDKKRIEKIENRVC